MDHNCYDNSLQQKPTTSKRNIHTRSSLSSSSTAASPHSIMTSRLVVISPSPLCVLFLMFITTHIPIVTTLAFTPSSYNHNLHRHYYLANKCPCHGGVTSAARAATKSATAIASAAINASSCCKTSNKIQPLEYPKIIINDGNNRKHNKHRFTFGSVGGDTQIITSFLPNKRNNECAIHGWNSDLLQRYGGRATPVSTAITRTSFLKKHDDKKDKNERILGFDLKMVSSSSSSSSSSQSSTSSSMKGKTETIPNPNHNKMSPIKKQVVKNILKHKHLDAQTKRYSATAFLAPTNFEQQIETLNIKELRDACHARGLVKTGNKLELQQRLFEWIHSQHERRVLERNVLRTSSSQPLHDTMDHHLLLQQQHLHQQEKQQYDCDHDNNVNNIDDVDDDDFSFSSSSFDAFSAASAVAAAMSSRDQPTTKSYNKQQLGDDTIEPLINKRKALLRSKQFSFSKNKKGVLGFDITSNENENDDNDHYDDEYYEGLDTSFFSEPPSQDYLNGLTKTFHLSKSVVVEDSDINELDVYAMNNYQLNELYLEAKHADQNGNVELSKVLLNKLYQATPHDTRVIRRLARLEMQDKNYEKARNILQSGLRALPNDVHLLQGLAQLERNCGNLNKAREYFKQAIQQCPTIPNPYHALGTLEHSQGNIRAATTILRSGLKLCPSNHRLHHALGDLYREAKMLDMAEKAYMRGLKCLDVESDSNGKQMNWSRSFFYTGMSYLSYDRGDMKTCRRWLKKGIEHASNKLHSQGWLGLAQLEETEGNIDEARRIYHEGLRIYEKHRGIKTLESSSRTMFGGRRSRVTPPKLGDKWLEVYESSIRLEEKYGDYNSANNVYSQAATAFPNNWNILASWARFQKRHSNYDRARTLFELACRTAGSRDSEPYRLYAEFEMSLKKHRRARSILYLGARALSDFANGSLHDEKLSNLYHLWAIVEWHLGNLDRSEVLFDHSLRLTNSEISASETRHLIFLSIARFLCSARQDYSLAQHCVSLSLTENSRSKASWLLWSKIATTMGNEKLSISCQEESEKLSKQIIGQNDSFTVVNNLKMNNMLRRSPWHHKIFDVHQKSWYETLDFPDDDRDAISYENTLETVTTI